MNPEEYDKKIAEYEKENPKRIHDMTHLEEFDICLLYTSDAADE